ncbi:MAG: SDR family oxidoreductase [Pseudomonadota bacterium]
MKKALITGASGGIGKTVALMLASHGYDVAVHYNRSKEAAIAVCREAEAQGVSTAALAADISNPDAARGLVNAAAAALGGLSVVVNNVGNWLAKPTSELSADDWRFAFDTNLHSTFYVTSAAVPHLRAAGGGRIVNFAAAGAHHVTAWGRNAAYMTAKTGVVVYTKSLARDVVADNITVNAVLPGIAENSFEYDDADLEAALKLPAGRPARLSEIAHAVWFFVQPDSAYITGQTLEVAGGWGL